MGLLDDFSSFIKTPEGIGLLSSVAGYAANAQRGAPINSLGRGAMAGVMGYGAAQQFQEEQANNEINRGYRTMQMDQMKAAAEQQQRLREALANDPSVPYEVKNGLVPYSDWYKQQNESFNLAPGEKRFRGSNVVAEGAPKLPDGMEIGPDGQMRFMPSYLQGKKEIAAAGRPNVETKIFNTAETEQAKAWGKTLGDLRSNIATGAFTAPSKLAQLDRMEQLLQGVEGGKLAPIGLEVASAAKSIGLNIDPKLGNKEAAEALSREIAGSFRKPGEGVMTDKDFENFLKRVPDLSKTAEGRNQIFKTMRSALKRDIEANKIVSAYAKKRNGNIDDGVLDEISNFYAGNPVVEQQPAKAGGFKIIGVR